MANNELLAFRAEEQIVAALSLFLQEESSFAVVTWLPWLPAPFTKNYLIDFYTHLFRGAGQALVTSNHERLDPDRVHF
jgi:hypothetical protein